jgi:hypothetical protein
MIATAGAAAILVMPALQDGWSRPGRAAAGLAGGGAGMGGGWTIHAAFPPRTPADVLPGRSLVAHVAGAPVRIFHLRYTRGRDLAGDLLAVNPGSVSDVVPGAPPPGSPPLPFVRLQLRVQNLQRRPVPLTPERSWLKDDAGAWLAPRRAVGFGDDLKDNGTLIPWGRVTLMLHYALPEARRPAALGLRGSDTGPGDPVVVAQLGPLDEAVAIPPQAQDALNQARAQATPRRGADGGRDPVAEYRRALRILPGWIGVRLELGFWLSDAKRYPEAIAELRRACDLDPFDPALLNSLAWIYATASPPSRNPREARSLAEQAVRLEPNNTDYLDTLAEACYVSGRPADALAAIDRALLLKPGDLYLSGQRARFRKQEEYSWE